SKLTQEFSECAKNILHKFKKDAQPVSDDDLIKNVQKIAQLRNEIEELYLKFSQEGKKWVDDETNFINTTFVYKITNALRENLLPCASLICPSNDAKDLTFKQVMSKLPIPKICTLLKYFKNIKNLNAGEKLALYYIDHALKHSLCYVTDADNTQELQQVITERLGSSETLRSEIKSYIDIFTKYSLEKEITENGLMKGKDDKKWKTINLNYLEKDNSEPLELAVDKMTLIKINNDILNKILCINCLKKYCSKDVWEKMLEEDRFKKQLDSMKNLNVASDASASTKLSALIEHLKIQFSTILDQKNFVLIQTLCPISPLISKYEHTIHIGDKLFTFSKKPEELLTTVLSKNFEKIFGHSLITIRRSTNHNKKIE
ncbi:MAG: hypothetical protein JW725_02105, partial [Candidatus Babeliaceae bacterium]|nr:hypothetical protein [Candidatus Babeliaceae bacterium]